MKAIIIGYGKMGREIERILAERGHEVTLVVDQDNVSDLTAENLARADVAIEFTTPSTAPANIMRAAPPPPRRTATSANVWSAARQW